MAVRAAFEEEGMKKAGATLNSTADELQKKLDTFVEQLKTDIGTDGVIWSGKQADDFITNFTTNQVPEIEKAHQNVHNQGENIIEQANKWVQFDEQ